MRCPTLAELPSPPRDKSGWPWTEASPRLSDMMPDGRPWPKISIVTPSYNQEQFIEETIRSVLLQGYPNLEYVIIDGGSIDDSVRIIKKYEKWISDWISEKDNGQSDAINKGFEIAAGSIMAWLNSDDLFAKDTLHLIATQYKPGLKWWTGKILKLDRNGTLVSGNAKVTSVSYCELLHARRIIHQVATFWTRELWNKSGRKVKPYHFAIDYELWLRFSELEKATPIDQSLGILRVHEQAKTGTIEKYRSYLAECDVVRLEEYRKHGISLFLRTILITFWTRYSLAKQGGWRDLFGRRAIPYV